MAKSRTITRINNRVEIRIKGLLHGRNQPAVKHDDGTKEWWSNGKRHRSNGPAVVEADGTQEWWREGKLHRLDGPATIKNASRFWRDSNDDGDVFHYAWWVDGHRHRLDGPAVEYANGGKEWFQNGVPHRVDGPAVVSYNGEVAWWVDGEELSGERYKKVVRDIFLKKVTESNIDDIDTDLPFSQMESFLYAFEGWVKNA
jgi:hypothetical protein